jgi:hypothetical protein
MIGLERERASQALQMGRGIKILQEGQAERGPVRHLLEAPIAHVNSIFHAATP